MDAPVLTAGERGSGGAGEQESSSLWLRRSPAPPLPCFSVAAVAAVLALGLWSRYVPQWRSLWTDVVHDRNAHLELGLGMATDLSRGRVVEVVRDIDRARTWPPLHDGVLVPAALLVGGLDVRAAVLPSLI